MKVAGVETDLPRAAASGVMRSPLAARIGGVVAAMASIGVTLAYMAILDSYIQNDYFWTHFNETGVQTFLSDVFNAQLWTASNRRTPLDLFSTDVAMANDYSAPHTMITIQATRNRRIAAEELNAVAFAIPALRATSIRKSSRSLTCHCWLDFDRRWEVAYTTKRQQRCHARYTDNGAVYLEAMLRNTDWPKWYAMWGSGFDLAYGDALRELSGGAAWLEQTTSALATTTVDAEIDWWRRQHISRYTISWHNHQEIGFDDAVTIRNALSAFSIPLHHAVSQEGLWTSYLASVGVWNGYYYAVDLNVSLVRGVANSLHSFPDIKSPELWTGGYPDTVWTVLLHDTVGPIGSIDILYVQPPPSFLQLYAALHKALLRSLHTNEAPMSPEPTQLEIDPPKWRQDGMMFAGGNPLCYTGTLLSYVQQSIGFDDACMDPVPAMTVDASSINLVLSLWLLGHSHGDTAHIDICAATAPSTQSACEAAVWTGRRALRDRSTAFSGLADDDVAARAIQEVHDLGISLMQYAALNDTPMVLHQSLLDEGDPAWSFLGWLHLLDWVQGVREVLALDGDESTVVLMSKQYRPQSFVADPLATPYRFAFAVWVLLWYFNVVMFAVVGVAVACATLSRSHVPWRQLVFMNRVAGVVWIGRPLLILRGLTAMTLLSTANMQLTTRHGLTSLAVTPRSAWEAFIVAGESLWLTYAINDILSLATGKHTLRSGALCAGIVWTVSVVLELVCPVLPAASTRRRCVSSNMEIQMSCVSGDIEIGSFDRFVVLCVVQGGAVVVSWCVSAVVRTQGIQTNVPVLVPAVALTHFALADVNLSSLDWFTSILSGFLSVQTKPRPHVFSVLLWVYLPIELAVGPSLRCLPSAHASVGDVAQGLLGQVARGGRRRRRQLLALMGLVFLVASVASSASFIVVTESQFTNNFLWEGFNSTGMQAFLVDWYNFEVIFRPVSDALDVEGVHLPAFYNGTVTTVTTSQFAANTAQFDDMSVLATIAGLQTTSPCDLPWLATQFCWVDFRRRWEVANSDKRQRRCDQEIRSNGAVYIEALFRNTDMSALKTCWGDALDIALFEELGRSSDGRQWIQDVARPPLLPVDELAHWTSHNVTAFIMQWQNYKSVGLVETLLVQSALGLSYPLTMKRSNGTYRFDLETSRKMYWGWAGDLWAVAHNATVDGRGGSLIRTSATFAFRNHSIEAVLAQNNTISVPLDAGLSLLRSALGPFGSTDMHHLACPEPLLRLVRRFLEIDQAALLDHVDAQHDLPLASDIVFPLPTPWQNYLQAKGGNILCPATTGSLFMPSGMITLTTMYMPCGTYICEYFPLSRRVLAFASMAWGAHAKCTTGDWSCIQDTCSNITVPPAACTDSFTSVVAWTDQFVAMASRAAFYQASLDTKRHLVSLQVELTQYAKLDDESPLELLRIPLFDPSDPHFELIAWQMVYEWVMGLREVVSFQGDTGRINVISSHSTYTSTRPNPLEVPTNVAFYSMLCLQYTTAVIFAVTFITILYIVASKGHIEGLNMLKVNRVAGIVWVGRPLLCLRSLVAIVLLATSSPKLEATGIFTRFTKSSTDGWVATLFSGSETGWLVIVLTDVGMAATKDLTNKYSWYSTVIVTVLASLLSLAYPVKPAFVLNRTCTSSQVNFQVECTAGVVRIGSLTRVVQLVVLTSVVMALCYLWQRRRRPQFKLPQHNTTLWLPGGALYLYHKRAWILKGTLHLDKASAFMCGLIAVAHKRSIYVLDVKTWRVHTISLDNDTSPQDVAALDAYHQRSIASAVPLTR